MPEENKEQTGQDATNVPKAPPGGLPVVGERKFLTHTMEEDVMKAKMDPAMAAKLEETKKPFSEYIPPPPPSPSSPSKISEGNVGGQAPPKGKDEYREPISAIGAEPPLERDQPFSFPKSETEAEDQKQQFQIYIPPKRSAFSASTLILLTVLVLLLAGGGFGYWWFFMRAPAPEVATQVPEPTPQPQPPAPVPVPQPAPEPEPQPIPEPEPIPPEPEPLPPPPEPAPTPEPAPEPVPIPEPTVPQAVLALDQTLTLEIAALDKTALLAALDAENAKVTSSKATIRYLVKLSTASEKRYLSLVEIGQALGFSVPATLSQSFSRSEFVGYKSGASFRYGFVASVTNEASAKSSGLSWESAAFDDLKGLYIQKMYVKPQTVSFSANTYLNFYKRFLNMPEPDVSLDWAVSPSYFVVATSKEMIFALLDETGAQSAPQVSK